MTPRPSMWSRVKAAFSTSEKHWTPETVTIPSRLLASSDTVSSPYSEVSWVYAAITRKADKLASAPLDVLVGSKASDEGVPLDAQHPSKILLRRPSPLLSASDLVKGLSIYLDVYGEAFVLAFGKGMGDYKRGEIPAELMFLAPPSMQPEIDKASGILVGWSWTGNGKTYKFPASQVGHVKLFNPDNLYRGLSPLSPLLGAMTYQKRSTAFNNALMANGADPGGIMSTSSPVSEAQRVAVQTKWEDRHRGSTKAGRIAVLSGDWKYQQISVSQKDLAFDKTLAYGKSEILACLGMTRFDIGEVEATNYASASVAESMTWKSTILPRMNLIEDALWGWLFEPISARIPQDIWAAFDVSRIDALNVIQPETATTAATLIAAGFSRESVNERLGLGLEVDAEWAPAPEEPPAPTVAPPPPPATPPAESRDLVRIGSKSYRVVRRAKAWTGKSRDDSATEKLYRTNLRKMFRELKAEELAEVKKQQTALDAALLAANPPQDEGSSKAAPSPFKWPPAFEKWMAEAPDRWEKRATEILSAIEDDAASKTVGSVKRQLGGFAVVSVDDPAWVKEAAARTASMIQTTRKVAGRFNETILRHIGTEGLADVAGLSKAIEQTMGAYIVSTSMTIARTETGFIQESIKNTAALKEGYTHKEWSHAYDARESHQHQGSVEINERFPNGLMHPCEIGGPPEEVINCRCTSVPFVAEEALGNDADLAALAARKPR